MWKMMEADREKGYSLIGFLLIYCTLQMISEQSQTAGTTLMPSLLRRSIPMLAWMVWSWMWRNVRYLPHPDMPVHWMSSGQRKTKSLSKVPSKYLAPGWPETVWLCVDQNSCIWKVRRFCFWEHWRFFSQSSNIWRLVWNVCAPCTPIQLWALGY